MRAVPSAPGSQPASARAHIDGDLPRVLAATYVDHYARRCDYARFRADFLLLATPLQRVWQRLSAEVSARWFPPYLRALNGVLPAEAVEHLTAKRVYDPLVARGAAFERGEVLAAAPPAGTTRVPTGAATAHPDTVGRLP